jgi:hypothetical protein
MGMREFASYTEMSMRQVQNAETYGIEVKDTVFIVWAFKTGVDYHWLRTGRNPDDDFAEPLGDMELPGLDSNQEPIGSCLPYFIRRFRGFPNPPYFLDPHPPDTTETVSKSRDVQLHEPTESPKKGPEKSNVYYLPLASFRSAA